MIRVTSGARRLARLAPRPTTLEATGLSLTFLSDLLGKHLATAGVLPPASSSKGWRWRGPSLDQVLQFMRAEGRVEVRSRLGQEAELRFGLTDRGRDEAGYALHRGGYVGPAPVPLDDYVALVARAVGPRTGRSRGSGPARLSAGSSSTRTCATVSVRRSIHAVRCSCTASAGTGKTYTARRLSRALQGLVLVPHAISVNESVIEVFDPLCHERVAIAEPPSPTQLEEGFDPRLVPCERPIVLTGGELAADMLEVQCDAATRTYSAPIQMKANNGFLLIDDLGRQRIAPAVLFNRWIVPLDTGHDSLTTGKGHHFEVPFDLVLVFSTNLQPAGHRRRGLPAAPGLQDRVHADPAAALHPDLAGRMRRALHRLRPAAGRVHDPGAARQDGHSDAAVPPAGPARDGARSHCVRGRRRARRDALRWAWDSYFLHKGANEFKDA